VLLLPCSDLGRIRNNYTASAACSAFWGFWDAGLFPGETKVATEAALAAHGAGWNAKSVS